MNCALPRIAPPLAAALIAATVFLAAAALEGGRAQAATTARCTKPLGLSFTRKIGATAGTLRWRAPRVLPASFAGYRIYRNGLVVGQVRGKKARVRFTPGKKTVFGIKIAQRNSTTLPCRTVISKRLGWRLPTTPTDVTLEEREAGILVTWSASRRGDGRLVGYRVFKDGTSVGQGPALSALVAVPALRTATIQVGAVDNRGKLSPLSTPVTIVRGHTAPTAPAGLSGTALSDRDIEISWAASATSGGARVTYLVLRDGKLVRNTAGTSLRIGNLRPATTYALSIVAVDSLGYRSTETPPLAIATLAPRATGGSVYAFLLASTDRSFQALQERYRQVGTVIPTYFECNGAGSFLGADDPLITGWAKLRNLRVHARWNCQRTATLASILHDPALRQATIDRMVQTTVDTGYNGVNLDFEAGAATDRGAYTSFVHDLADRLHAVGKALSLDVSAKVKDVPNHPRSTFFDYRALAQSADVVFVMAWGLHWSTSGPGAIDELPWFTKVADYVASQPSRAKFVLGLAMYGTDWPAGGGASHPGVPLEYEDVTGLARSVGATPVFDAVAGTPHFSYTDGGGVAHDVWYADAASVGRRLELARERGLRVGLWRLGREDPGIWSLPSLQPTG